MTDQLISFETAKLAKEKGFCEPTINLYDLGNKGAWQDEELFIGGKSSYNEKIDMFAPTQSLLQKWLREKHDIYVNISSRYNPKKLPNKVFFSYDIAIKENNYDGLDNNLNTWLGWNQENDIPILMYHTYNTYEEALEAGLQEALTLIK